MFFKELPPLSCLDRDRMMEWETGFGMDRISRTRDETEALRAIKTRRITGETSWHPWECRSRNLPWRECFVNSLAPTRTVGECGSTELALGELGAAEQQWNAVVSGSDFLWITHIMVTTLTSILLNGKMSMQLIQLKAQCLLSVFCLCSLLSVWSPCECLPVTGPSSAPPPRPARLCPAPATGADTDQECQEFGSAIRGEGTHLTQREELFMWSNERMILN